MTGSQSEAKTMDLSKNSKTKQAWMYAYEGQEGAPSMTDMDSWSLMDAHSQKSGRFQGTKILSQVIMFYVVAEALGMFCHFR